MVALQVAGEELRADVCGAQLLGQGGQVEALVLVHHERDRHPRGAELAGQGDGLVRFGADGGASGDLLGEDGGDAGGLERVESSVQGLAGGGGAGVADGTCPAGSASAATGRGQLDPGRARPADGRGGNVERLASAGTSRKHSGSLLEGPIRSRAADFLCICIVISPIGQFPMQMDRSYEQ
ncbi:hypothetical protein GCM10027187_20600 [Streptosporangium sandarakinum]